MSSRVVATGVLRSAMVPPGVVAADVMAPSMPDAERMSADLPGHSQNQRQQEADQEAQKIQRVHGLFSSEPPIGNACYTKNESGRRPPKVRHRKSRPFAKADQDLCQPAARLLCRHHCCSAGKEMEDGSYLENALGARRSGTSTVAIRVTRSGVMDDAAAGGPHVHSSERCLPVAGPSAGRMGMDQGVGRNQKGERHTGPWKVRLQRERCGNHRT